MSMALEKSKGPECPKCGCNDTELVHAGWYCGCPWARYRCNHCGETVRQGSKPKGHDGVLTGVIYRPVKCPSCGSKSNIVASTRGRVRYHRCHQCDLRFKSVEE